MAGALDVRLGGRNVYSGRIEDRPQLGDGPRPVSADVHRAVRLSRLAGAIAVTLAAVRAATGPVWRLVSRGTAERRSSTKRGASAKRGSSTGRLSSTRRRPGSR